MNSRFLPVPSWFVLLVAVALSAILTSTSLAQDTTGTNERVSVSSAGAEADSISYLPAITPDGRTIAFQSEASNLVGGDTNDAVDIFLHDRDGIAGGPRVTGFSPTSGPMGTAATTFTVVLATQINATVPTGATSGPISVTTPGGTATSTAGFTVTAAAPPIYLSPAGAGNAGGKAFTGADILTYAKSSNTWDVLYDGSAIQTAKNVGAFSFVGNDILLGFSANQPIAGLGTFAAHDLARFTPTSLGYNNTAGSFAWYFDGSDVGLSTTAEKLDALWIDANGRLYISTTGTAKVPGPGGGSITAQDEDILRFTPTNTGANTTGTWSLYWNPTAITGMSAEDINGYWEDPATGSRYVTIVGAFNIGNVAYGGKFAGDGKTILRFAPNAAALGGWAPVEKLTWLATGAAFPSTVDGIEMTR